MCVCKHTCTHTHPGPMHTMGLANNNTGTTNPLDMCVAQFTLPMHRWCDRQHHQLIVTHYSITAPKFGACTSCRAHIIRCPPHRLNGRNHAAHQHYHSRGRATAAVVCGTVCHPQLSLAPAHPLPCVRRNTCAPSSHRRLATTVVRVHVCVRACAHTHAPRAAVDVVPRHVRSGL